MSTTKDFIIEQLKQEISGFKAELKEESVGHVLKVLDGIALVSGLSEAMMSEILIFNTEKGEVKGVVLNLEDGLVGTVILGDYALIKEGDKVSATGRILEVPVGESLIGRVVNPLGEPIDGKGAIKTDKYYPVEKIAPGVITRAAVNQPMQTGRLEKLPSPLIPSLIRRGRI
jgi:F-type H+-transporting ATPase subunit alpha